MQHQPFENTFRVSSFTLVEMLVVISVISLLASIGYTGLNEARAYARDARRTVLLHDLRLSLEQYYDEYGFYPPNMYGLVAGGNYTFIDDPLNQDLFPFKKAGIILYPGDSGSTLAPNPDPSIQFMQYLRDAGLWNQQIPNDSLLSSEPFPDGPWPWRQPNGLVPSGGAFSDEEDPTSSDMCGAFIRYRNNAGWAGADNASTRDRGPQVYFIEAAFERKKSFDTYFPNDKDTLQFDGEANASTDDNEYSRTALQHCPWGKSMTVFIHHCAGEWRRRTGGQENANNQRGYPETIPMHTCYVDDEIINQEFP